MPKAPKIKRRWTAQEWKRSRKAIARMFKSKGVQLRLHKLGLKNSLIIPA